MNIAKKLLCCAAIGCAAMLTFVHAKAEVTQNDKEFLAKASQADIDEIKLSELAEQKATNPQVKAFAHKMVVDHTALERQMKPFADAWQMHPATQMDSEHQEEWNKLNGLSGAAFDKEYMSCMVKDHHLALDAFQHEAATTTDAKFKQAVMHGESVVASHMHLADSLAPKVGA